jgi:hypothetical protein
MRNIVEADGMHVIESDDGDIIEFPRPYSEDQLTPPHQPSLVDRVRKFFRRPTQLLQLPKPPIERSNAREFIRTYDGIVTDLKIVQVYTEHLIDYMLRSELHVGSMMPTNTRRVAEFSFGSAARYRFGDAPYSLREGALVVGYAFTGEYCGSENGSHIYRERALPEPIPLYKARIDNITRTSELAEMLRYPQSVVQYTSRHHYKYKSAQQHSTSNKE